VVEAPVFASAEDAAAFLAAEASEDANAQSNEQPAPYTPLQPLPDLPAEVVEKMYVGALEALKEITPASEPIWWE
jgi:hypothetical protein